MGKVTALRPRRGHSLGVRAGCRRQQQSGNPIINTRSFGEDPHALRRSSQNLCAAWKKMERWPPRSIFQGTATPPAIRTLICGDSCGPRAPGTVGVRAVSRGHFRGREQHHDRTSVGSVAGARPQHARDVVRAHLERCSAQGAALRGLVVTDAMDMAGSPCATRRAKRRCARLRPGGRAADVSGTRCGV